MQTLPILSANERKVLKAIYRAGDGVLERELRVEGLDEREIASAVSYLERKGIVSTERVTETRYQLGPEGLRYLSEGLPERRAIEFISSRGSATLQDLFSELGEQEARIALAQLARLGIRPVGGRISAPEAERAREEVERSEEALRRLASSGYTGDLPVGLQRREGVVQRKQTSTRRIKALVRDLSLVEGAEGIGELTHEAIVSGSWRERGFSPYDLHTEVSVGWHGGRHPLSEMIDEVREIFLEMGFQEMKGHYIESALWNMDALFIPQDHPAREMQDTFYIQASQDIGIEHPEIVDVVKRVHERGWGRYVGWRYRWSVGEARKLLLRTHTTVTTIRYLYENPEPPLAIFSVERVFRHESVDWKHLAELHQIEGAVHSRESSLSTLKWLMRYFYSRLGFREIRLVPSYYPYTEPSMDVIVKVNGREVELGGSGVFRPEVTRPLGIREPVIAWGLGLERLAMLYYGLDDIRKIYQSDLSWLMTYRVKK
ncbi:phenylalanine--tRNA ligase subunit alpha [Thermogymnomonas acidicola]|uniref:Phenylalanine--tRNA ligase alpha subunit n=1 Tax=Thermogymnomonas acidicola TaxID=399579 RepID=A0AA37FBW9_9ARCH|nr:phenylalanine--tRNA ligase subunit alpha [Thermogymnomonas acidicola]GGM77452.1 phenylalanine--tRNA ligase subunit alpha [Thermogymnomonas acidicola]